MKPVGNGVYKNVRTSKTGKKIEMFGVKNPKNPNLFKIISKDEAKKKIKK